MAKSSLSGVGLTGVFQRIDPVSAPTAPRATLERRVVSKPARTQGKGSVAREFVNRSSYCLQSRRRIPGRSGLPIPGEFFASDYPTLVSDLNSLSCSEKEDKSDHRWPSY